MVLWMVSDELILAKVASALGLRFGGFKIQAQQG